MPAEQLTGARLVQHVMGMAISIDVRDGDAPMAMITEVAEWFEQVDNRFSTFRTDSEISRLGRAELTLGECNPDVAEVLALSEAVRQTSNGFFDVRARPDGSLDPSGMVKGWAVDRASDLLLARGSANHCINAGGDVRVRGRPAPGRSWQVGVVHPFHRQALTTIVAGVDFAVATSGVAERGMHVFDPHTRSAVFALASVTVVGPDLTYTDAYATAALAMGLDAPDWLASLPDHEAYVIDAGDHVWSTAGFARYQQDAPAGHAS